MFLTTGKLLSCVVQPLEGRDASWGDSLTVEPGYHADDIGSNSDTNMLQLRAWTSPPVTVSAAAVPG